MSSVPLSIVATADLPTHLADATANEVSLRRFLFGLPGVDPVGIEQRAAGLATRSIKRASKLAAIDLAISMVDLTTWKALIRPEGAQPARKAMLPDRTSETRAAAICLPRHGAHRGRHLKGSASRSHRSPRHSRPLQPPGIA